MRGALVECLDFRLAGADAFLDRADLLRLQLELGTGALGFELRFGKLGALGGERLLGLVEELLLPGLGDFVLADLGGESRELVGGEAQFEGEFGGVALDDAVASADGGFQDSGLSRINTGRQEKVRWQKVQ